MDGAADVSRTLVALARSRSPADRERLLAGIGELCAASDACRRPEVQAVLTELLLALVTEAEHDIRRRLVEALADAAWAPPALMGVLAREEIDIARPVIARSPVLEDGDLVRLLVEARVEHAIEVARRPCIGPAVVTAILDQDQPAVLTELARNDTARVDASAMGRLVAASQRVASVRAPLARHPRLTPDLALSLYAWVGEALQSAIATRFRLDPATLSASLHTATRQAHAGAFSNADSVRERDQATMEERLVAKLDAAGQLRPGYLLRVLREGKLGLFEQALATLGGFEAQAVSTACEGPTPRSLALACAAVGLDRSVFPTVLSLVQGLNGGRPHADPMDGRAVAEAFTLPPNIAAEVFGSAAQAV